MNQFCYSCGAPLSLPEFKGPAQEYCIHCTDQDGNLKPADQVKVGVAEWLKTWQPDLDQEKAVKRAEKYMQAMPAWAE